MKIAGQALSLKYLLIFIMIPFFLIIGYFSKTQALSFPFVDEQDNFAIGKYLMRGEIIYEDIITNHQPLTYIFSALVQEVRDSNTTFSLLVNHRVSLVMWSGVWALILVGYFGMRGFLFVIFYEPTKIYMFGNLFLAEAMVVYPLLFISGIILGKKDLDKSTLVITGVSFALIFFTLSPMWLVLFFLGFLIFFRLKNHSKQKIIFLISGMLLVTILVGRYTSVYGYIQQSIYANLIYTVPQYHESGYKESWIVTVLKSFVTPLFSFTRDATPVIWIIRLLTMLFVVNVIYMIGKGRFSIAFVALILLGLSNIRFIYPGEIGYTGFHLLPWYSLFIFITLSFALKQIQDKSVWILKTVNIVLLVTVLGFSLQYGKEVFANTKDIQKEYTLNYSTHTDIGSIISIMKSDKDTLFVSPNAWLVYWQSKTDHLPKLYGYYAWMSGIPGFHEKVIEAFSKNPPTFFYCEDCRGLDLGQYLDKYQELKRNEGGTNLFVLPEKIKNLTDIQKDQLKFYGVN